MQTRTTIFLCIILLATVSISSAQLFGNKKPPTSVAATLSTEEAAMFELIQKYYPDFIYSSEYKILENGWKEMIFVSKNGLIAEEYISYQVMFNPDDMVVYYTFDAGIAYRGKGSFYIFKDLVVQNIATFGTSYAEMSIYENGEIKYSRDL